MTACKPAFWTVKPPSHSLIHLPPVATFTDSLYSHPSYHNLINCVATIAVIIIIGHAMGSVATIAMYLACYNYPPLNGDVLIPTFVIEFLLEYTSRSPWSWSLTLIKTSPTLCTIGRPTLLRLGVKRVVDLVNLSTNGQCHLCRIINIGTCGLYYPMNSYHGCQSLLHISPVLYPHHYYPWNW
jgi:hypothetical protein